MLQDPHENDQIHHFDRRLKQLGGLERHMQRSSCDLIRQVIGKGYAPPVVSFLAVAASSGEAAQASNGVAQGEAGSEGVANPERRQVMAADIPGGRQE